MGAAQGVEARLRAGGVGGGVARAALGAHGGVWRRRRARAAQGALRWMRGGENGSRRREWIAAAAARRAGERRCERGRAGARRRRGESSGGGDVSRGESGCGMEN